MRNPEKYRCTIVARRSFDCILAAGLLFCPFLVAQSAPDSTSIPRVDGKALVLDPGRPIAGKLRSGEKRSYTFPVKAGEFVHVVALQKGADIAVTLFDPNGKQIASMDSLNGSYGPEPVSAVGAVSGNYRVEIASLPGQTPAGAYVNPPAEGYEVRLSQLRPANSSDRRRMQAEQAYMEGMRLWPPHDEQTLASVTGKWRESFLLWQSVDDKYGEALSLFSSASAFTRLRQTQKSLDLYNQALSLSRGIADLDGQARALRDIGSLYESRGEEQKALDYYNQLLPIYRRMSDRSSEAKTLDNLGRVYSELGETQKGLDCYDAALVIFRQIGDRYGEATMLDAIGHVYSRLSEKPRALDYYNQALPIYRQVGDRNGEATMLNALGLVYDDLGNKAKALEYYNQALPVLRQVANRANEAMVLNNIGGVYQSLGEEEKALDYFSQALAIRRQLGGAGDEATMLNNIGGVYQLLGEEEKALDYFSQALAIRRQLGDRGGEALALNNIGLVHDSMGDSPAEKQKALDYYTQALPVRREVRDRVGEAQTLSNMGVVYGELGEKEKALDYYDQALAISRAVHDPLREADTLLSLMSYWRAQNRPALAILFGKQGIDLFQEVRRNLQGLPEEDQQSFVHFNEGSYRHLAELLVGEGRLPEAQEVLDLLKVEEFSEYSQRRGGAEPATGPVPNTPAEQAATQAGASIEAQVTALGEEWSDLDRKPSRTPQEQARYNALTEQLAAANRQMQDYFKSLYEQFGKGNQANENVEKAQGESSGLQNLMREMTPGTVALYTIVLDQKCVILVITPTVKVAREVPISRLTLRLKAGAFVYALGKHRPQETVLPMAQDFYKLLIAPIEKDLEGAHATTLVWSLDDVLRYIPIASLYDGKQYMAERYTNVVLTTASIGDLKDQPKVSTWRGLAMGVSKAYDPQLGGLTAVPGELDSVVTSVAVQGSHGPIPGTIILNDGFTEKSMAAALNKPPPLVHIATHFVLNSSDDEQSYLLLGGRETGGEGYHLSLADLRDNPQIKFSGVELLTLSACQTATGSKDNDGREMDGLGMVGQMKGAKAVIATLWPVDDASVGILMGMFYKLWTTTPGMTKAEALRQAQLALLHGTAVKPSGSASSPANQPAPYADPYYWAPFILMGNWK